MPSSQRIITIIAVAVSCAIAWPALGLGSQGATVPVQGVVIPPTATTLEGIPTVRIDVDDDRTTRRVLDEAERAKNPLTIRVADGKFYWASRQNRPLQLNLSGEFTYLSSEPGQYIRLRRLNDRISYVEHVDQGFGSVTYMGELRIVLGR